MVPPIFLNNLRGLGIFRRYAAYVFFPSSYNLVEQIYNKTVTIDCVLLAN